MNQENRKYTRQPQESESKFVLIMVGLFFLFAGAAVAIIIF